MLCIFPFALLFGCVIGGAILRLAILTFNKLSGASSHVRDENWDEDYEHEHRPDLSLIERRGGVAMPTFARCMVIILISLIVQFLFNAVFAMILIGGLGAAPGPGMNGNGGLTGEMLFDALTALIGFITLTLVCHMMLPTTILRALGVAVSYFVICITTVVVIAGFALLITFAAK